MTRENKLALVIGFGLILFVGVLVSDHFSAVKMQDAADLAQNDSDMIRPTNAAALTITDLDPDPRPPQQPIQSGLNQVVQGPLSRYDEPLTPPLPPADGTITEEVIRFPDIQRHTSEQAHAAGSQPEAGFTFHSVAAGETLFGIARRYLGDGGKAGEIAALNNISDPASIRKGHRLRIPAAGAAPQQAPQIPGFVPVPDSATPRGDVQLPGFRQVDAGSASTKTYTVKSGDLLSTISQKTLGTSKRWKEIAALNPQLDPNNMKVGTVIKLPAR
jgi:nucleoid-associated protein YgaU